MYIGPLLLAFSSVLAASSPALVQVDGPESAQIFGSGSVGFARLLAARDPDLVRAWFDRHERARFHRPEGLLKALINSRLAGDQTTARERQSDARFLSAALAGRRPGQLIETVVAWDLERTASFIDLEYELGVLFAGPELPDSDRVAQLREASVELGAPALLTKPWSRLVPRLHAAQRSAEAVALVEWIRTVALEVDNFWSVAWCVEWQAQDAWRRGELRAASDHLARAVEIDEMLGDGSHRAHLLCELASVHIGLSDVEGGLAYAEQAEALARTLDDPQPLRLALEAKAGLHFDLGEHQTALEICTSLIPSDPERCPGDLTQLHIYLTAANILSDVGRVESALGFSRRALELADSIAKGPETGQVHSEVLLTLGLVLGDDGQTREALALLAEARAGFEATGDPVGVAWAEKNRGWVLLGEGDIRGAVAALENARETGARLGLPYLEGLTALGIAEALVSASDRTGADRATLADALVTAGLRAAELSDLQLAWRAATVRGRLHLQADELQDAYDDFEEAVELVERWRRRLQTPGLLAHSLRNKADPYREAAFVAARLGHTEDALRMTELLRARVLMESRSRSHGPLAGADEAPLRLARRRVVQAERGLRDSGASSESREKQLQTLAAAEADLDAALLVAELGAGGQGFNEAPNGPIRAPRSGTARELAARIALADYDQVLSFLLGPDETLAFVADATGVTMVILPHGVSELSGWIARLRDPVEALRRGEVDLTHLGFDYQAARSLHEALIRPLHSAGCEPRANIVILADGVLNTLPFELLVVSGEPLRFDPTRPFAYLRGLTFFAEQHRIAYSTSIANLSTSESGARGDGNGFSEFVALVPPIDIGVASAGAEIAALQRVIEGDLELISDASPRDLTRTEVARADVLHLLAHGAADPVYPAHGHLLLGREPDSQAMQGPAARLEAWQIEELSFSARLTVLSACHTAEGAWYHGEGLFGLTRSFLAAGSKRVVGSRWAVEDRASTAMMELLYGGLARGLDPVEALHRARLTLMARDDPRGFALAHPYFWAGWVLHR